MASKTFVLDTNVFLHDPNALQQFEKHNVVMPISVLEELETHRKRSDQFGRNARDVLQYIDSLKSHKGDFVEGIKLPKGPTVRLFLSNRHEKTLDFPYPLDRVSNRVLYMAYFLQKKGEKVVYVSRDFVSRVKAQAMKLVTQDYEMPKINNGNVYSGLKKMQTEKLHIDQFFKDGEINLEDAQFYPNEYCYMHSDENSSALGKYNVSTKMVEPLVQFSRDIWGILPLNVEQRCAIDLLLREDIQLVTLIGAAGTGKTLLALACGMRKVFDDATYNRILISRPIVPLGKDIGYLPGTKEEKLNHWMQPIFDNLDILCEAVNGQGNGRSTLEWIQDCNRIEMEAVTYIRGRSLPKIYMIIDEAQNLTPHEVKTIISRAGKGTKVVLTGDPWQIDNPYLDQNNNGLTYTVQKFKNHKIFGHMYLDKTERSELAALAAEIM